MSKRSSFRLGQEAADIVYVDASPEWRSPISDPSELNGVGIDSIYMVRRPTHWDEWIKGYNSRMQEFAACDMEG